MPPSKFKLGLRLGLTTRTTKQELLCSAPGPKTSWLNDFSSFNCLRRSKEIERLLQLNHVSQHYSSTRSLRKLSACKLQFWPLRSTSCHKDDTCWSGRSWCLTGLLLNTWRRWCQGWRFRMLSGAWGSTIAFKKRHQSISRQVTGKGWWIVHC